MKVFRIALTIICSGVISLIICIGIIAGWDALVGFVDANLTTMFIVFLVLIIAISYYLLLYLKLISPALSPKKSDKAVENSQQTLSQKYSVLGLYKVLAYLLMIVNTAFTIYSFVQISEASNAMKKFGGGSAMDNANLTLVITYFISMFSLFCLTKMIDFLFDLERHKSDK